MSVEEDAPADRERAVATTSNDAASEADDAAPKGPTHLPRHSWRGVFTRTFREYKADNLSDWAAALTYYGVLAIFPAAIALISIVGLVGHSATGPLIDHLGKLAPGTARQVFISAIQGLQKSRGGAGVLFVVGILGSLWAASSYVAAFMRASNAIYDVAEGRPFWMTYPVRLAVTIVMVLLLTAGALAVVITGGLAGQVGKLLGVGGSAVTAWDIAKWPVLLLVVGVMFAILYWASPNVKQPGLSLADARRAVRGGRVGACLSRVRPVRVELRLLQQDLRRPRRRDHLPGVAVDQQRGHPARRRAQRRARASPGDRGRASGRRRAVRRAAPAAQAGQQSVLIAIP